MAQYPVPQFIESEGKIISFLTFRQFFIVVGGGAICFGLYYLLPFKFFVVPAIIVALLTAAVAFLKINDMPLPTMLFNMVTFSTKSKNYTWRKKESAFPFKAKEHYKVENLPNSTALNTSDYNINRLKEAKNLVELRKK